ncbi:MAG: MFS transporter [Candidatus Dormibacteria bacterium]
MNQRLAATGNRTFRSLKQHRNYRLYFFGQVVSLSGTWMQNIAMAWFVLELSHGSPIAVGALALCQFGPYGIGGLFGGALADRLNARRVLLFTQSSMMAVALGLFVLAFSGDAQLWMVYVLATLNGTVLILDTPVRQSFTIEMVGREELPNAIALNSSLFNASRVVGPSIAGVLIAVAGVAVCFLINAVSFVAVVVALLLMRDEELFAVKRSADKVRMWRGVGEGLVYAWRTPILRLVLTMMLFIATISINFNVLLPVLASQTLHSGAVTFGIISGAFGLGALAGALTAATLSRVSLPLLLAGALGFGAFNLLLAPLHALWAVCLALLGVGFAFSLYGSQSNATLQVAVSDRLRGRVMSLYGYVFFGTAPIGGLLTGWLCAAFGTGTYLLVAGGTAVVVTGAGAVGARGAGLQLAVRRRRRSAVMAGEVRS